MTKMEPIKQLIHMMSSHQFRAPVRTGDSNESFVAYMGQERKVPTESRQAEQEGTTVELSALARLFGALSPKGREALGDLLDRLPEGDLPRQDLTSLLLDESGGLDVKGIEDRIKSLSELLHRLSGNNGESQGYITQSLRELKGLGEAPRRFFFDMVDEVMDLDHRDLSTLMTGRSGLSDEEYNDFLKVLSNLLKRGVVGVEEVRHRDQDRKTFVVTRLGDSTLRDAEPARRSRFPLDRTERKRPFER